MKELIETGIVLVLVLLASFLVFTTQGKDKLDWNFNININADETFDYEIVPSEYNGEYAKNDGTDRYVMVGKNPDGTYRVYFIRFISGVKSVYLRMDALSLDGNGKALIRNNSGAQLNFIMSNSQIVVNTRDLPSNGDRDLEGVYMFYSNISRFNLNQFKLKRMARS